MKSMATILLPRIPSILICLVATLLFASFSSAWAAKAGFKIEPGPKVMSAEEQALAANPNAGAQHGVILLEETESDDTPGGYSRVRFHRRAKIFSNEGRDLANIEIPFDATGGFLTEWWGRTILPDGQVLELPKEALAPQTLARSRGAELRVIKGALPGVAPGAIIDYGWTFDARGFFYFRNVPLQRAWLVRVFRYRWVPATQLPSQYLVTRRPGVEFTVERKSGSVLIEGKDLPPVAEEPWMPPDAVVRVAATLHYTGLQPSTAPDANTFWDDTARRTEEAVRRSIRREEPLRKAIASMNLSESASLSDRLWAAYDWIHSHVADSEMRTVEEEEADPDGEKEEASETLGKVLEAGEGTGRQIDYLFIGFARLLGAEAHVVFAADRRENYWEPQLLTARQFGGRVVAVKAPEEPGEKTMFVDPGSGLPFGEIPWWLTPTMGLQSKKEGAREIGLRGSDPRRNVLDTQARIAFLENGARVRATWSETGGGQCGFEERRELRRLPPVERQTRLDDLCGSDASIEVTKAEAPALMDLASGWRLECEADLVDESIPDAQPMVSLSFDGPWIAALPEFPSPERVHPVILPYPRIDTATIDVAVPPGFIPAEAPAPLKVTAPFAEYVLRVSSSPSGFRVVRELGQFATMVPQEEYAILRKFLEDVRKADRTELSFTRAASTP